MKHLEVDVDRILEEAGKVGKYQIRQFIWIIIPVILCSLHSGNYVFVSADTDYRCRISECEDTSGIYSSEWVRVAIPKDDKCHRFLSILPQNSSWTHQNNCSYQLFDNTTIINCDQFVFKNDYTLIEELNIPCNNWKRTLLGTINSAGNIIGILLIGLFSDRFGRRHALVLSCVIEGFIGIVKSFSTSIEMLMTLEFLEPSIGAGAFSSAFVMAMELLTPSTRVLGGSLLNMYFGIGQILIGFFAWIFPYWRTYIRVMYIPSIFLFVYYWICEESIRWLITKFRYQEAIDNIKKIAETNGKSISSKALENLMLNAEKVEKINDNNFQNNEKEDYEDELQTSPWKLLIRSRVLVLRMIFVSIWWTSCTFCFNGLSINSYLLPGNFYVNYMIQAAMELPSHVIAYYSLDYFGRRKTLFISFFTCGISLLSFSFIHTDLPWLSLMLYLIAKLFIALAINGVYIYTSELFPTQLRHSLLSMCSTIGRIGAILAPLTPLLIPVAKQLPSILFSVCCLISSLLMLTSPETLNKKLPETVKDAENLT